MINMSIKQKIQYLSLFILISGCASLTVIEAEDESNISSMELGELEGDRSLPTSTDCEYTICGDECLNLQENVQNCGMCGNACEALNAVAVCVLGDCQIGSCEQGYIDADREFDNGCEESENMTIEPPECVANGQCMSSCNTIGQQVCNEQGNLECVPPTESCNLEDDDCDGDVDEQASCKVGIHRGYGNQRHVYSSDLDFVQSRSEIIENTNYFKLYQDNLPGLEPVYSCEVSGSHTFLSTDSNCGGQGNKVRRLGYWNTNDCCQTSPLYFLYHPSVKDHLYTTNPDEIPQALSVGFENRGIIAYVWNAQ